MLPHTEWRIAENILDLWKKKLMQSMLIGMQDLTANKLFGHLFLLLFASYSWKVFVWQNKGKENMQMYINEIEMKNKLYLKSVQCSWLLIYIAQKIGLSFTS